MSLRTSLCPFPQKEQDRLPWWWLSFLLMSPPLHASVRGQREGRQPRFWAHVVPLSESIDVRPVTPETRRRRTAGGRPHASPTLNDPRSARTGTCKAARQRGRGTRRPTHGLTHRVSTLAYTVASSESDRRRGHAPPDLRHEARLRRHCLSWMAAPAGASHRAAGDGGRDRLSA